jgi:uncharacterized Zn-binding protein involved in type VI secretion
MGTPAVVKDDRITGACGQRGGKHMVPNPSGGSMPAPAPLPFAAPLTTGLAATVVIAGKPAAVQDSQGTNDPPHAGLHPSDPAVAPPKQVGRVVAGSATVFFDGRPAAFTGCKVTMCLGEPGQLAGSATTVLVAG